MRSERLEAALRRSRARIVEAGLLERRRLERNLHDGAQQRLVALSITLPVKVVEVPGERLPEPVEAAAYFVIAEALTNVAKYAHANAATVAVRRINGHACVEIRDDGVGGADPGRGSGLRGLADRVGALDGSLALDSPPGSGTTLRAEIPV
jgi:signal transduction histidine kinase